jgi:hypothetical protein
VGLGWIGTVREVHAYLATVRADREPDGAYILRGRIAIGYDGAEAIVDASAEYRLGERWASLAEGLGSTSYGMRVRVY